MPPRARMILLWTLGVFGFLFVAGSIALLTLQRQFEPMARKWLTAAIQKRYQGGVEFGGFHASLYPIPKASVEDLVIRFHGRTDVPPLAKIKLMTLQSTLWGLRQKPVLISEVTLEGLEISIPPKQPRPVDSEESVTEAKAARAPEAKFVLERVVADGMVLRLVPRDATKDSRDFEFERLTLKSAAVDRPMEFQAKLANWKPPGKIETSGHFGPWEAADPGETPLDGKYTFREADLSVFKGIAGTLSSDGEYSGRLEKIACSGTTDTPDFRVSVGKPVDLKTTFRAIVDGTNGDTELESVVAHFLRSSLVARGSVINTPAHKGHNITLTVDAQHSQVEDFLHLVVNAPQPMMVGAMTFRTSFQLPPGHGDVMQRLYLQGHLNIPSARFTSLKLQDILGNVSRRAEGDPRAPIDDRVASSFSTDFVLKGAECWFSRLVFDVPGAEVRLTGSYGLHGGELDFAGQARTVAKISQMTTGIKSKLLKLADPFFAKDGAGAVVPIKITGTRTNPKFGLNFRR